MFVVFIEKNGKEETVTEKNGVYINWLTKNEYYIFP